MFSFNSAVGACEACRGFGRVIGVDYGLVIPNDKLTLRAGAIKVFQTPAWKEAQDDMMRHAEAAGIPRDTPWAKLTEEQKHWVRAGSPQWNGKWNQHWYGVDRFFEYLESKAYKMHIRVLLSKYRSYTECPSCGGARLKTDSLLWRLGTKVQADAVLKPEKRYLPHGVKWSRAQVEALPGLCLHDLMLLPLDKLRTFFTSLVPSPAQAPIPTLPQGGKEPNTGQAQALKLLLDEINTRIRYLCEVGIGYLTLDRQSRTLSGGEVPSAVCARRTQHRPAPARHGAHQRRHAAPARCGQHAGGGRARPGRDAGGRPPDRHGPRPGRTRRADRVRRHARGDPLGRHADWCLPRRAQDHRHGLQARGDRQHAAPHSGRRARAQPEGRVGRVPAAAPGGGHRCLGLGQVQPDPGRARARTPAPFRQVHRHTRRPRPSAGCRATRRGGVRRPVAHRQDRAFQPGELCGRVGRHPRAVRRRTAVAPAQLHARQVQLQQRRRALPHLRRLGL
ncbi:MAG: hypothetical protein U1C86_01790 [Hydrogenophaga sp.]|nr:hypothetical protein [Hydrogenophaga sp.]MDZ4396419.1 hypothetical protein [Hydrogenophaga sp.]